jgi:hypothetical protein
MHLYYILYYILQKGLKLYIYIFNGFLFLKSPDKFSFIFA